MPKINKGFAQQSAGTNRMNETTPPRQIQVGDVFMQQNETPYADTVAFYEVTEIIGHNRLMVAELNQSNSFMEKLTFSAPVPHQFLSHPFEVVLDAERILRNNDPIGLYSQYKTIDIGLDHPLHYYDTIALCK